MLLPCNATVLRYDYADCGGGGSGFSPVRMACSVPFSKSFILQLISFSYGAPDSKCNMLWSKPSNGLKFRRFKRAKTRRVEEEKPKGLAT